MNGSIEKYFNRGYVVVCLLVFIVVCFRAFFIPFSHDEASTFFFYIQSNNYLPYRAHLYTNNHVLNSALANVCYHLAGSHRFILRVPNVLAFVLLCLAVFSFFKQIKHISSKILLTCFFILTFNFLDFFELCRGYGLSISLMVLGLSYLQRYFDAKKLKFLVLFSVCWQLALAANLTLVVLGAYLFLFVFFFQKKEKIVFEIKNLVLLCFNLGLLAFWLKFSLIYKAKGLLDSGIGEGYWTVTFRSLLLFIFGTDAMWIQVLLIVLFSAMFIFSMVRFFKLPFSFARVFDARFFYLIMLVVLLVSIFFQKKLLQINYPEDRTGLFLYILFVLALVLFFDTLPELISSVAAGMLFCSSLVYFVVSFNIESFTHYFYHVLPKEFYTYLENENKKANQLFTIGGHPNREMNYAFLNYRAGGLLNPMDEPIQMQMNCDYYIALMVEKPFFRFFYDEVAYDNRWHRVLLKRKQKIKRVEVPELTRGVKYFNGNAEYFEFLRFFDSTSITKKCIEVEVEIEFKEAHKPFKAFIVLQVNDEKGNLLTYKRALLNWLGDDLSGQNKRIKLTSSNLPGRYKNILVYLWNIDKKEGEFELKQLKILNLSAPGINVVIPHFYYPYAKKIINEELL